jgi:hypothetical protein
VKKRWNDAKPLAEHNQALQLRSIRRLISRKELSLLLIVHLPFPEQSRRYHGPEDVPDLIAVHFGVRAGWRLKRLSSPHYADVGDFVEFLRVALPVIEICLMDVRIILDAERHDPILSPMHNVSVATVCVAHGGALACSTSSHCCRAAETRAESGRTGRAEPAACGLSRLVAGKARASPEWDFPAADARLSHERVVISDFALPARQVLRSECRGQRHRHGEDGSFKQSPTSAAATTRKNEGTATPGISAAGPTNLWSRGRSRRPRKKE